MEIVLPYRSFTIANSEYNLVPRLESVTRSIGAENNYYEILTSVFLLESQLDSGQFFCSFPKVNYFSYLRDVLSEMSQRGLKKASFNVNEEFLKSAYLAMLIEDFRGLQIALEISETIDSSEENIKAIRALTAHPNISIWLDDFGCGFSNFDTIEKCNFDAIKISKELFWRLFKQDKKLLSCLLINLRKKAGSVIVEGVDCFEKYVFCKELNLLMQGYFFRELKQKKLVK